LAILASYIAVPSLRGSGRVPLVATMWRKIAFPDVLGRPG